MYSSDKVLHPRKKTISILTPCYNEEENIKACYERVKDVFDRQLSDYDREHVFIDNASQDQTVAILRNIAATDPSVKIIVNARNFGISKSPYHGIMQTTGDAVVPLVADLQTPPELIVDFVRKWEEGYKMVVAVRQGQTEGFILSRARTIFYKIMARMSNVVQIRNFIGFGLFDRQIIEILRSLDEPDPYFRGLVSEIGFEKAFVNYLQPPRLHGVSKHSIFDLAELALLALTTYSKVPIRLMTITGIVVASASVLVGFGYLLAKLMFWDTFPVGTAPMVIGMFFLSAVNLLALGLVGEYVGLILQYTRRFPLVVEKERVNFVPADQSNNTTRQGHEGIRLADNGPYPGPPLSSSASVHDAG